MNHPESQLLINEYLEKEDYSASIRICQWGIESFPQILDYHWYLLLSYLLQDNQEEAQKVLISIHLQNHSGQINKQIITLLETFCLQNLEKFNFLNAKKILNFIYSINQNYQNEGLDIVLNQSLDFLYQSALELVYNKDYIEAESRFKKILEWIDDAQTWYNLAVLYFETQKFELAKQAIHRALLLDPNQANYYYTLGLISEKQGHISEASDNYNKAIALDRFHADAYNNLGNIYRRQNKDRQVIEIFEQALNQCPKHHGAYINLGNCYLYRKNYLAAEKIYKQALHYNLENIELYDGLAQTLIQLGKNQEVLNLLNDAIQKFPNNLFLQRKFLLFLPTIYETSEEILEYRERFSQGLKRLINQVELEIPEGIAHAYEIINGKSKTGQTNFYLAYQGYNDLVLQKKYGQFVHQIMASVYPQWMKPRNLKNNPKNRKIKIGYISQRMQSLLARLLIGWIENADKNKFEIYSYYIGDVVEINNQYFQVFSDYYYHFPNQIEETASQILQDEIDILVYFEIGLDPLISQLANLRLAPVQCATWGHPMTTGFPTIDYFLSSDVMEPSNAQEHYSEQLIRLPKLGFNIVLPPYLEPVKKRSDFGLNDHDVLYLSCQALQKYLPQHDYLFVEIYRQVAHAKFIFINRPGSETITKKFKKLLEDVFQKSHLDYRQACYFLPGMPTPDYFNLIMLSDVFLDTICFSGGFTSLDAIACNLPIVTLPTDLMRGRQSYGMLRVIDVTETIAYNEKEYIEIAVRLGLEPQWRKEISQKIKTNKNLLFNDLTCVQALEDFYFETVKNKMETQL